MRFTFFDFMDVPLYDCDSPYNKGLGGAQSAVCYYAEELAKAHNVSIFLVNVEKEFENGGVHFYPAKSLLTNIHETDVVIWGSSAKKDTINQVKKNIRANLTICLIPHNQFESGIDDFDSFIYDFDLFAFVSEHQRKEFVELYNLNVEKTFVMMNGICPSFLTEFDPNLKTPKFLYTSQPYRGLDIIEQEWDKIVEKYPEAELHTYSSRKLYGESDSDEINNLFEKLKTHKNVFIHDPVSQNELVKVCQEASFFAYPTDFIETGCIAVTEACAGGCLPIVSNVGCLNSYFDDCLIFNEKIGEQFVQKSHECLDLFYNHRETFNEKSLMLSKFFKHQRDYKLLSNILVDKINEFLIIKKTSVDTFENALALFKEKRFREATVMFNNMVPYFESIDKVYIYYLNKGVCAYHCKKYQNALINFKKASKHKIDLQLCVNMILTAEKLENKDLILEWCENALKFKFNLEIMHKIMSLVQKKSYFERTKWGKYLLSLWNDDINNNDWLGLFLSHGNMVASDYCVVMKQEECIKLLLSLIEKGLAHMILNKVDIKKETQSRKNIEKLFSNLFLNLNYYESNNPNFAKFVKYFMESLPTLEDVKRPIFKQIENGRKIRVGFLSGDFIYHPVSYVLNGIVENFDKTKFEVYIFSTSESNEKNVMQNRLKLHSTQYIDLYKKSISEIKDKIIEKDIDVLIEMSGHTNTGSDLLNVLRYKPARVVAQYFAYPNTYGVKEVDYKIGDDIVFPTGLEKYYTEKFCKIENGFHTYKPIMDLKVNKKEHSGIVFGCTNNPKKYRPEWIKSVSKILSSVEGSKLKMRYFGLEDPSLQEFYFKEFEKHGIHRSRIDMDIGESLQKYFESYCDMDICLDPFPYNGGTINIEILYAGLPYITLLGNSYVSRVGASILTQVGHPELIAKNMDEYVKLAVDLAKDPERLAKYKETLRADMEKSTLGDNKAFTRNFENGIMWMLKDSKQILPTFSFPKVDDMIVHESVETKKIDESIPKLVISESF